MRLSLGEARSGGAKGSTLTPADSSYYDTRAFMTYLGQRDGADIYRDPASGVYYVDSGAQVSRVGTPGFKPHPVDRERFSQLSKKYNPSNLPWTDFILASYEGKEQDLWDAFFQKYVLGPKPKEPTWGKGIRKARWAQYEEELEAWEAKRKQLTPQFKDECAAWNLQRQQYDEAHRQTVSESAGRAILQRALSGASRTPTTIVIQTGPTPAPAMAAGDNVLYQATVPPGLRPGDTFLASAGGVQVQVKVPPNAGPGSAITFTAPGSVIPTVTATPVAAAPAPVPPPAALKPASASAKDDPFGIYGAAAAPPPPAAVGPPPAGPAPPPPPPANGAAAASQPPPPPRPPQTSMNW